MYSNTGYLKHTDVEIEDRVHPLLVTGCGIYRMLTVPSLRTFRPDGRRDFQLLYVSGGSAVFYRQGKPITLAAGSMTAYFPGEPQEYIFSASRQTEVCWVHFSGTEAASLLRSSGFGASGTVSCSLQPEYRELFQQMIQELQFCRTGFEDLLPLLLRQLLVLIRRGSMEAASGSTKIPQKILEAVRYFNEHFAEPISVSGYAENQHISVCWFIRSFRLSMGVSPMQYITSVRLNRARTLLESTGYTVQEIAAMVGYDNPLYFSRLFRKHMGEPPSHYRRH